MQIEEMDLLMLRVKHARKTSKEESTKVDVGVGRDFGSNGERTGRYKIF